MKKRLITSVLAATLTTAVTSCANYELGDVSRVYCGSTNPELRAQIKVTLAKKGLDVGVDYCATAGLVDALIVRQPKE